MGSAPPTRRTNPLTVMLADASITVMPNISVRQIDEEVMRRLRQMAAEQGVSMEQQVRQILSNATSSSLRLGELAQSIFGGNSDELDFELPSHAAAEPLEL